VLGLKNPVGSYISNLNNADDNQQVIGVVENTHFKSFKEEVLPIVYYLRTWSSSNVVIRINTKDIANTIKVIEKDWRSVMPDRPIYYYFIDDIYNKLYETEMRTSSLIEILSVLAISIALIGLLSLVNLISQMRRKEIGVRKVLGASILNIVSLVTREYLILIIISNLIAFPVSYYFLDQWLKRFIYRIEINVWAFLLAGVISFVIGVMAVCYKIIKAATANPVESLRYE
jgi:putative ABC transport system permease protein